MIFTERCLSEVNDFTKENKRVWFGSWCFSVHRGPLLSFWQPNTFTFIFRRARWSCLMSFRNWSKCAASGSSGPLSTMPSQCEACWIALALELQARRGCREIKRLSPANLLAQSLQPQRKFAPPPPTSLWAHSVAPLIRLSTTWPCRMQSTRAPNQPWRPEEICALLSPRNLLADPPRWRCSRCLEENSLGSSSLQHQPCLLEGGFFSACHRLKSPVILPPHKEQARERGTSSNIGKYSKHPVCLFLTPRFYP